MSASYFGGAAPDGPGVVVPVVDDGRTPASELAHDGFFAPTPSLGWGGPPALELARAFLEDAAGLAVAARYADELREILAPLERP